LIVSFYDKLLSMTVGIINQRVPLDFLFFLHGYTPLLRGKKYIDFYGCRLYRDIDDRSIKIRQLKNIDFDLSSEDG